MQSWFGKRASRDGSALEHDDEKVDSRSIDGLVIVGDCSNNNSEDNAHFAVDAAANPPQTIYEAKQTHPTITNEVAGSAPGVHEFMSMLDPPSDAIANAHVEILRRALRKVEEDLDEKKQQLKSLHQQHQAQRQGDLDDHDVKLETLKEELRSKHNTLMQSHFSQLDFQRKKSNHDVDLLKKEQAAEVEALQKQRQTELEASTHMNQDLVAKCNDLEAQLLETEGWVEKLQLKLHTQWQDDLADLDIEHKRGLHDNKLLKKAYAVNIANLKKEHEAEIEAWAQEYQKDTQKLIAQVHDLEVQPEESQGAVEKLERQCANARVASRYDAISTSAIRPVPSLSSQLATDSSEQQAHLSSSRLPG